MKLVAFDLGETFVEYEGLPPSWEPHYLETLLSLTSLLRRMACVGNEEKDVKAAKAFGCKAILLDRNRLGHAWGGRIARFGLFQSLPGEAGFRELSTSLKFHGESPTIRRLTFS